MGFNSDVLPIHYIKHKHKIATPLTRFLVNASYRIGARNDRRAVIAREPCDRGDLWFKKEPDSKAEYPWGTMSGLRGKKKAELAMMKLVVIAGDFVSPKIYGI